MNRNTFLKSLIAIPFIGTIIKSLSKSSDIIIEKWKKHNLELYSIPPKILGSKYINAFKTQLNEDYKITQEVLKKVSNKKYTSGRLIKVGDTPLWGYIRKLNDSNNISEINIELVHLHPHELGVIYDLDNAMYNLNGSSKILSKTRLPCLIRIESPYKGGRDYYTWIKKNKKIIIEYIRMNIILFYINIIIFV